MGLEQFYQMTQTGTFKPLLLLSKLLNWLGKMSCSS
jgi:hypothetical protein